MTEEVTEETKKKTPKWNSFVKKVAEGDGKTIHTTVISLLGLLLVFSVFNLSNASITGNVVSSRVAEAEEANRPAEIQLTVIDANCVDCFDISQILDYVKGTNIKLLNEERISADSAKARELISNYEIKKLPTVLVFGEIGKTKLNGFAESGDSLVYEGMAPPYVNAVTREVKGRVEIVSIVDSSCEQCISLEPVSGALQQAGVAVSNTKTVEYNSEEGRSLINKFEIKEVPSMLISKEIDYYESVVQQLAALGLAEKNGFYKLHSTSPPFRDLTNNKITGLTKVIYLNDESCTECYEVTANRNILIRLGVFIDNENTYDINSQKGKQFVSKYNIKKAPIVLVSPEGSDYLSFSQVWTQVGSIEDDGWFVMRKPELVGTYKGLESGEVVNPSAQQS